MRNVWLLIIGLGTTSQAFSAESEAQRELPADVPAVAEIPGELLFDLTTPDGLRSAYLLVLRNSSDRYLTDWTRSVTDAANVYVRLNQKTGLSAEESMRMRRGLKTRLELLRDRLIREVRRIDQEKRRTQSVRANSAAPTQASSLFGGGSLTAAGAQQLIEVITNTISPESWEMNGGKGRIMFYSPLNVLVIRATGEVHGELGDVLDQLRR